MAWTVEWYRAYSQRRAVRELTENQIEPVRRGIACAARFASRKMTNGSCRFCAAEVTAALSISGRSPLPTRSSHRRFAAHGTVLPLHAYVCDNCSGCSSRVPKCREIFSDYSLFSHSYSAMWLRHCRDYAEQMAERYRLGASSLVVEIASNDGYLLAIFQGARHWCPRR